MQSRAEKEGERIIKDVTAVNKNVYPTTTYKNYMVNMPAAGAAAPLIKAFAPARSAKKFVLKGSSFAEDLLAEVEAAQLPQRLGGALDDRVQWKRAKV